ncbi:MULTISPECIES: hypothetical protein [Bacteroides]|jgi:hypothetical protein|uniref:hypothetical protein n=1 Tax=Bacteroides TaxID=816 RepID=UPI0020619ED0|nr:hypothetical protein [Bacteroides acidifaciens]DAI63496.1 MAG TPA: hypothetical protein [Caudoviricetes sp.]
MNKQDVEPQVAEALLDVGVSIPLWRFHLPFRKKPVQLRMTMKRPKLGTQLRIARLYLKIGVTYEKMRDFTKEEQMSFMVEHGHDVCRMIALTICRGRYSGLLLSPLVSWILLWWVDDVYLQAACTRFVSLLGTKSFENIIRSAEKTNPTVPLNQSQQKKGS